MRITPNRISLALSLALMAAFAGIVSAQDVDAAKPVATATAPSTAPAAQEVTAAVLSDDGITVAKLSNGLTVIVKPVRAVPIVTVRAYIHTGAMYEREWLGCGLSHLTEHLVANGEEKVPGDKLTKIEKLGGQYNASTSSDWTNYYISAKADKASECIDLIAGWMVKPTFTKEDFLREHDVVQRELELGRNDLGRNLYQAHHQNMYGNHPIAVPVIGFAAPLAGLKWEDIQAYHKRMYVPNNMIFVIVGDVDVDAAIKRTCEAFAGFDAGRACDHSLPEVDVVTGTRTMVKPMKSLQETSQIISFQSIPLQHADLYALDLLSTILGEGASSRLYVNVLRKELVTGIGAGSWTPNWGKGEFAINFRCKPDMVARAEAAVIEQLKKLVAEGVTAEELARAKRQKIASLVHSRQSIESIAATLALDYMGTGDVSFSSNYTKRIQDVTAKQVQEAAGKYFQFDRQVVTRLVPQAAFSMAQAATQASDAATADVFKLPNGLKVVLQPVKEAGLVSMAFVTRGGLMLETPKTNGLGSLMAALSVKGTADMTAEEIARFFDEAGGGISADCANNTFTWQATVLEDRFADALTIFADSIARPGFPSKELDIIRPLALSGIKRIDENWNAQLMRHFRAKFFTDYPYSMLASGSEEVITAATADQLAKYHKDVMKGGASVLTVYGSFDAKATRAKIERLFAGLSEGDNAVKTDFEPRKVDAAGELHVLTSKNPTAAVAVGLPGLKISQIEDRIPLDVLDTIISGWHMPSGWLHEELRGKGLVYVVHAYNFPGLAPGAFITYANGQPEKAMEIVNIIRKHLANAARYTPTQAEIDQAVGTILTTDWLGKQEMNDLAIQAALDELYGFGYDFRKNVEKLYKKVTPQDVNRVAAKYFGQGVVVTVTTPKPELVKQADFATTQPAQ